MVTQNRPTGLTQGKNLFYLPGVPVRVVLDQKTRLGFYQINDQT